MKWSNQLVLSNLSSDKFIGVDLDVSQELSTHHKHGIRFLYQSFRHDRKGVILNHDAGMNCSLQVAAFLNAMKSCIVSERPVLIICSEDNIKIWHYHLTIHGKFAVSVLSQENLQEIVEGKTHKIILSSVTNKVLREIKYLNYFYIVVDELDKVITKNCVKGYDCKFKIGLTHRNFLKEADHKLLWSVINWCEVKGIGKLTDFCMEFDEYLKNFQFPYQDFWHRLTWGYCDLFERNSKQNNEEYRETIRNWSLQDVGSGEKKINRKRKTTTGSDKSNSKSKNSRVKSDEVKHPSTSTVSGLEASQNSYLAASHKKESKENGANETVNDLHVYTTGMKTEAVSMDDDALSMLYGDETTEVRRTESSENNNGQNSSSVTENSELSLLFGD